MDRWNLSFSTFMSRITHNIGANFRPKLSERTSQEFVEQKYHESLPTIIRNLLNAMRAMELTN
jgi:hypothetical protein